MESLKNGLLNFCKGFGVWMLLLFFNTRSGEPGPNSIKILLNIVLAIILVSDYKLGRYIAILTAAMTIVMTLLPLPDVLEVLLVIGTTIIGWILLKYIPEESDNKAGADCFVYRVHNSKFSDVVTTQHKPEQWKCRSVFNPFERYYYSKNNGIKYKKGFFKTSNGTISTVYTKPIMEQNIWQKILHICDISFISIYTGLQYGDGSYVINNRNKNNQDIPNIKNIRKKSGDELMKILNPDDDP